MKDPSELADLETSADDAKLLARYLRTHPPAGRPRGRFDALGATAAAAPVFLAAAPDRTMWLVRWPDGKAKWTSAARLAAQGLTLPLEPLILNGRYTVRTMLAEVELRERERLEQQGRV